MILINLVILNFELLLWIFSKYLCVKCLQVAATGNVCGDLANPLLVLPLQPVVAADIPTAKRSTEPDRLDYLVGPGYRSFEESVLKKLQKVCLCFQSYFIVHASLFATDSV